MLFYWDIAGVFIFAISGALAGRQKSMDFWGIYIMALVTSCGGGTLRSILIGDVPPFLFTQPVYLIVAAVGTLFARFFPSLWDMFSREVSVLDALGLGIFVCIGTDIALDHGLSWWAAAGLGVITATFGGVIRDVLRNEVPLIFRKEIYATAALGGSLLLMGLQSVGLGQQWCIAIATVATAVVRLLAIRYAINQSSS
ncbi:trimeric intracellular cation channel family protein [Verrucomicrobiaceae bacterium N1E253]|uniref:Trimeric intracellular cation channel family protein n=1 Tax=Oceaniferula marina TaxID=2748318 RepID=A0A851GAV0_9BACT|nr:trimeric intracellular cation channel family protein [Oceaniferula marina]NWK54092.1 trimeric intracellular cation channel family protein [Oceaniferula marina]